MDFFSYQDEARRNTTYLVLLFVGGVVLTIVSLYVAIVLILSYTGVWVPAGRGGIWSPTLLLGIVGLTGMILAFGSGSRWLAVRQGGAAVAESLGGRPLNHSTDNLDEQRLLNIVEEMAIASGMPAPPVYILDQEGINAFAAGHSMNDAVIGVTRGAVDALSRDEMQGVIAHEFAHIANEDVRLNLRLIVVIAGLLAISMVGKHVLFGVGRASLFGGMARRGRSKNGKGGGQIVILLVAVALLVIGYIGVLCSRLIKAAISRQREFLADASATQFTRNPDGLAGALAKIRSGTAQIEHPRVEEASHMFFGDALGTSWASLSTHPPLEARIERLSPKYLDYTPEPPRRAATAEAAEEAPPNARDPFLPGFDGVDDALGGGMAAAITGLVGTATADHLQYGKQVIAHLPTELRRAAHESLGAVALAYSLVLDPQDAHREKQVRMLQDNVAPATLEETHRLTPHVLALDRWLRLPLAELLVPALRQLSEAQFQEFASTLKDLMLHDDELSIFQFAMLKMVLHQVEESHRSTRRPRGGAGSIRKAQDEVHVLLSALALVAGKDPGVRKQALRAGLHQLETYRGPDTLHRESFARLNGALDRLAAASPKVKRQVVDACAHTVLADDEVTLDEGELLRAIGATLNCPLPPFLPQARVA